jgi:hypothetical protein
MMHHNEPLAPATPKGRPRDANPSRGALRQRRYMARRAKSLRVVPVALHPQAIAALRILGYLRPEETADAVGLGRAVRRLLNVFWPPESWPRAG